MKIIDPKAPATNDFVKNDDIRLKGVTDFIDRYGLKEPVLVFGEQAPFERKISELYGKRFHYTNYDLNYATPYWDWAKTLFCCEVIEHLLNPLLFFNEMRRIMADDSIVYLTYPIQPHVFWSACHFHEYDKSRFHYLLYQARLGIVDYKEIKVWKKITGIRPIIRNTPLGRLKIQIYVLRKL